MATYSVSVTVNVPSIGAKTFTQTGVVAATPEEAMTKVKAGILVEVIALQKTA